MLRTKHTKATGVELRLYSVELTDTNRGLEIWLTKVIYFPLLQHQYFRLHKHSHQSIADCLFGSCALGY